MYNLSQQTPGALFDPLTLAILLAVLALITWKRRGLAMRFLIVSLALLLIFTSSINIA
jgi:hypothetical protein